MEIFDVVDKKGVPTGETIERSEAHRSGIRHRTAHVWVVRKGENGWELLLQKRSQEKDSYPGCYDTSSAGHIHAGDEPLISALRELEEELGITAKEQELDFAGQFSVEYTEVFHGEKFWDNEVGNVFVYSKPVSIENLRLQTEEVESVEWLSLDYVGSAINPRNPNFCVPSGGYEIVRKWCLEHS